MKQSIVLILGMLLFLAGCNIIPGGEVKTDSLDYKTAQVGTNAKSNPVQMNVDLPVEKLIITSGENTHQFDVELASTDAQRKVGLMNRKALDENRGMLFLFEKQGYINFWMKNTYFALDMVFIDENGYITHIAKNAQPCIDKPDQACHLYSSEKPSKYVLEIKAGTAERLDIRAGDKVSWL